MHAVMCGAGHSVRLILAKLRLLCAQIGLDPSALLVTLIPNATPHHVELN